MFRRFDDGDVVAEFDGHALRIRRDDPDAFRQALRRPDERHGRRIPNVVGDVDGNGRIHFHVRYRDVEQRIAALALDYVPRELDTVHVTVICEDRLNSGIDNHGAAEPSLDPLDEVLFVDRRFVLRAGSSEGDEELLLAANVFDPDVPRARHGRLDEAVRSQRDLFQASLGDRPPVVAEPRRDSIAADDIPRILAIGNPDLTHL